MSDFEATVIVRNTCLNGKHGATSDFPTRLATIRIAPPAKLSHCSGVKMTSSPGEIIYLFTAHHTGTHFARMLLESHPSIPPCIDLTRQLSAKFKPGYVTPNRAAPMKHNPEIMTLGEALQKACEGQRVSYLCEAIRCYGMGFTMTSQGNPFALNNASTRAISD